MTDLFYPAPPDEIIPREVLRYYLSPNLYISLWQVEGYMWEIRDYDNVLLCPVYANWNNAIDAWELCKPRH